MLLERLIALLTGAIVAICLGLGLVLMATGPAKKIAEPPAPGVEAVVAPAPAEPLNAPQGGAARAKIEALIAGAPEYAGFFERLRDAFPSDYDAALDGFSTELLKGKTEESVDYYLSEAVRLLRQSRGTLAAKAEPAPLARIFEMELEVLRAIATEDKHLCVSFLYGGANQDFQKFANGRRTLVADMAIAGLVAIASGRAKKIERTPPSEADFRALENALTARGLGKVEIDALLDGKMPDPPLDDSRMCAAGQTYLEVLSALPEATRLRIYGLAVELMARS